MDTRPPDGGTDIPYSPLFPFYLIEKQPGGNNKGIIKSTWEQYNANNCGNMLTAIDQVLQNPYSTTLATEFPKFTWNNYFMITGTYDIQVTNVYTNPTTLPPAFTGPQWQLFRSHLQQERKNWQAGNAGVNQGLINQYPWSGIPINYSSAIEKLAAGYVEFLPRNGGQPIAAGSVLSVTITLGLPEPIAQTNARISILPIINFSDPTHPNNRFISPQLAGVGTSNYSFRIANFDQCNRATVIANVLMGGTTTYNVTAEIIAQPPTTPIPPCYLQLP